MIAGKAPKVPQGAESLGHRVAPRRNLLCRTVSAENMELVARSLFGEFFQCDENRWGAHEQPLTGTKAMYKYTRMGGK